MSRIVLGVGASHSTLMNTHWSEVAGLDRAEAFRAGLEEARREVTDARPDVAVLVGSNHFRGLWLDLMPAFAIGVGDCVASGEAGTPEGRLPVDVDLARHVCRSLVAEEFDVAFSTELQVDHGLSHAVQYLLPSRDLPIVPVVVNVFAPPLPSLRRCRALGSAIRRSIAGDGADKRIVVVGSGGLSHRLPFPRWEDPRSDDDRFLVEAWSRGRHGWREYDERRREITRSAAPAVEEDFDQWVLGLLERGGLAELTVLGDEELEARGGNGAQELRTWLTMAAACGDGPGRTLVYSAMPEWLTGMAVALVSTIQEEVDR